MNYKLYYSTIKNRIGLQQISAIDWKYFNSDEFTVFGVNTNFNYQYEFFKINLGYNCNATYNAYFDKLIASNKVFYNHTLVLSTTVKYPKWNIALDVDYKYNGKIQSYYLTDNQDIINSNIGDYHVVDLSMNKYFLKEKLQCIVGVKNLTNTRQVSFVGDIYGVSNQSDATTLNVQWGRSFFTALIFKI
jgi:outer membrane receptor for ferrienterochelin and colicins